MNAKKFEDLIVWQKAHKFVLAIYRFTDRFPRSELFALTSQFRRAVVSIPANIAEGFKKREKIRLLNIAQGSLEECQYYLILSQDLEYGDVSTLRPVLDDVAKLLERYIQAIERDIRRR
jgi:four helix bundle protein